MVCASLYSHQHRVRLSLQPKLCSLTTSSVAIGLSSRCRLINLLDEYSNLLHHLRTHREAIYRNNDDSRKFEPYISGFLRNQKHPPSWINVSIWSKMISYNHGWA
ncbi:hypothetical protein L2E82_14830 [Cichorium intybus]|uniref:Uncharacterized protein n=1 Tax=Cichorium intybus TaxID=13427 RepID=A0ACB9F0G6_CICIN|nr:hypothetical protein L2E82_14830 [Cichorium intybus]